MSRSAKIIICLLAGGVLTVAAYWGTTYGDGSDPDFARMAGNFVTGAVIGGLPAYFFTRKSRRA